MAQDSAVFTRVINLLLRTPTMVRIADGTSSTNSLTLVECLGCFRQLPSDPDLVDTLQEGGRVEDWRGVPKVWPSLLLPVSSGSASIAPP